MQQAFLELNGVRTNVLTYGKWVEESFKSSESKDIILVIPGNPGLTGFYKMFMHTLNEKTGFPVWIVGHAGHEIPKKNSLFSVQALHRNEGLFGLKGQVEHKLDFIKKYVPEDARLHLVGHSIGSYMILELLKEELVRNKVIDVKLLFPAFEHMAETANGKFLNFIKPIIWLVVFLSWIYTILPSILSNFLITMVHLIEPSILEKVFFLAYEELENIKERNDTLIKENCNKIKFLYGHKDGWAPPLYCDKLKEDIPGVNTEMSQFDHTFVLKQSREVGNIVADWIC